MKKFLLGLFIALALVIIGGAIFVLTFDINSYRGQIQTVLKNRLGRDVTFGENMEFHLLPNPTIKLEDVAVGNPEWTKEKNLITAKEFSLEVSLSPLLKRQIVINGLSIKEAALNLEQQGTRNNWDFKTAKPEANDSPAEKADKQKAAGNPLTVNKAEITDTKIHAIQDGKVSDYAINSLKIELPANGNSTINFEIKSGDDSIKGDIKTGSLADWNSGKDFPFDAKIENGPYHVTASGQIAGGEHLKHLAANFDIKGANSFAVTGSTDLHFQSNNNAEGSFHLTSLVLPSDGKSSGQATEPAATPSAASSPAASRKASFVPAIVLPRNVLPDIKADLKVVIDKLLQNGTDLGTLAGQVKLVNGTVITDNLVLNVASSDIRADMNYNSMANPPRLRLDLASSNLNYGELLKHFGATGRITGSSQMKLNLNGAGSTLREIVANSDGSFSFHAGQGTLDARTLRWIGADIFKILLPGNTESDISTISCSIIEAKGRNGIYNVQPIALNTNAAAFLGKGTVDFRSETLNILLSSQPKENSKISELAPSVRVTGALTNPHVAPEAASLLKSINKVVKDKNLQKLGQLLGTLEKPQDTSGLENSCVALPKASPSPQQPSTESTTGQPVAPDIRSPEGVKNLLQGLGKALNKK